MRIVKEAKERKSEIIDAAERLFFEKSYTKTTINDILSETGIAKGTFYYYFKSKEDILDAIVERHIDIGITRAQEIVRQTDIAPEEKIMMIIFAQNTKEQRDDASLEELHKPENALMHQKSLARHVKKLTPLLTEVIEEGIRIGKFNTRFPKETTEIFLVAGMNLFDSGVFRFTPEEKMEKAMALIAAMERSFGAEPGVFAGVMKVFND